MGIPMTIKASRPIWESREKTSLAHEVVERLMRTACRVCKRYASDLYYDLMTMSEKVKNMANGVGKYPYVVRHVVSFRDMGVDGPAFTRSRLMDGQGKDYLAFYVFEARMTSEGMIEQTLARVDRAKMKLYVETRFNEKGEQLPEEA